MRKLPTLDGGLQSVDLYLMQRYVTTLLYGSDDERARMKTQAWYAGWMAQVERFAACRSRLANDQ